MIGYCKVWLLTDGQMVLYNSEEKQPSLRSHDSKVSLISPINRSHGDFLVTD